MSSPHGPYGDQGGAPPGPPPPQPQTGYGPPPGADPPPYPQQSYQGHVAPKKGGMPTLGTGVFYAGILLAVSGWFTLRKAGD